jgi:lipid II isoglutaminyl synthase (glutamine-hydrolysing)
VKATRQKLTLVHLYADEMNIYGDRGNVLALVKRLEWRGYEAKVIQVGVGQKFDFTDADIVFAGGGQDRGQLTVGADLLQRSANIHQAVEAGVVMLMICGTYQLFGRGFDTLTGDKIPGIGVFGAETVGSSTRMIGNLVVDSVWGQLVGFENHSGQTKLDATQPALGKVVKGYGNNETSGQEGAVVNNAFGTYLHGPMLPKNPKFTDHMILTALQRKHAVSELEPLDDKLEYATAAVAAKRPQ